MNGERISRAGLALAIFALTLLYATCSWSQTFKIIHTFGGPRDGTQPLGGLVFGPDGNLYGGTDGGGVSSYCGLAGCGTVFQLAPNPDGTWSETILHYFNGLQGAGTSFEAPVFDDHGNLYGTTEGGGYQNRGTVFELTPHHNGPWTFSSLYSFRNGQDGWSPSGIAAHNGTLFVTAAWGGGEYDQGAVINLTRSSPAGWSELTLRDFNQYNDGWYPNGLIFDASGNAYGTTFYGGDLQGCGTGTVYKLTQDPHTRNWSETLLYAFQCGSDGANPSSTLVFDAAGDLFSTTVGGGPYGGGTVFKLTPNPDGTWTESLVWAFPEGSTPYAGVTLDAHGNLYGVTEGSGVVYKLTPSSDGQWTQTILHQFTGSDGAYPFANVILDSAGNVYGTTSLGGAYNQGVAFEITP